MKERITKGLEKLWIKIDFDSINEQKKGILSQNRAISDYDSL